MPGPLRTLTMLTVAALLFDAASAARVASTVSAAAAAAAGLRPAARLPPSLPQSYTVNYTFTLPYTARLQQPALSYPVAFYRDAAAGRVRMDTYGGTQLMIAAKGRMVELVPRIDRLACLAMDDEGGESGGMAALPDLRGWQWGGTETLNSEEVDLWVYEARHEGKQVVYRFYAAADGAPRRLHMHGNDAISGAHFDEWVVDYTQYQPGPPDPSLFATPALCQGPDAIVLRSKGRTGSQLRWAALAPGVRYSGDEQYDVFLAVHGASRSHASLADYHRRRQLYHANRRIIEAHNAAPSKTFTLAMNRFGDYSQGEFEALMLPKRARRRQEQQQGGASAAAAADTAQADSAGGTDASAAASAGALGGGRGHLGRHELPYEPLADAARLPGSLTWRGTGADGVGVKDQATCGSCWSFAATGTMEGAWWRATGRQVQFSEQQVLDCSWGFKPKQPWANLACDGGDPDAGIGYVVQAGGVAENSEYPYRGQDGYCRANTTRLVGRFKGYARVPRYDDAALREALYSRGPVAISFDASRPSFRFFSSGVYVDTECQWKPDQLDHSMVLVGYGTGAAGDFWEVKNSWSTHWGEGGYFKVSRDVNHACGVPSDAAYAVVDEAAAA